jgi:hypothetical protein
MDTFRLLHYSIQRKNVLFLHRNSARVEAVRSLSVGVRGTYFSGGFCFNEFYLMLSVSGYASMQPSMVPVYEAEAPEPVRPMVVVAATPGVGGGMRIALRPYQIQGIDEIFMAWSRLRSVLYQMPTGTGKTTLFAEIVRRFVSGEAEPAFGVKCWCWRTGRS